MEEEFAFLDSSTDQEKQSRKIVNRKIFITISFEDYGKGHDDGQTVEGKIQDRR